MCVVRVIFCALFTLRSAVCVFLLCVCARSVASLFWHGGEYAFYGGIVFALAWIRFYFSQKKGSILLFAGASPAARRSPVRPRPGAGGRPVDPGHRRPTSRVRFTQECAFPRVGTPVSPGPFRFCARFGLPRGAAGDPCHRRTTARVRFVTVSEKGRFGLPRGVAGDQRETTNGRPFKQDTKPTGDHHKASKGIKEETLLKKSGLPFVLLVFARSPVGGLPLVSRGGSVVAARTLRRNDYARTFTLTIGVSPTLRIRTPRGWTCSADAKRLRTRVCGQSGCACLKGFVRECFAALRRCPAQPPTSPTKNRAQIRNQARSRIRPTLLGPKVASRATQM